MNTPVLYQINTRLWLGELSRSIGRQAAFDDIPDAALERLTSLGFNWLYLMGAWQTGEIGRQHARAHPALREEIRRLVPDVREEEICSSCFAITGYQIPTVLGGEAGLARLRERLNRHGLRLMLDFIPNHTAIDHPWVWQHPDYYIAKDTAGLKHIAGGYLKVDTALGKRVVAHGRDPYFPAWTDTLQLNYGNPALQAAMTGELEKLAECCDGVRCDMSMLVLPEVFVKTWGIACEPFWPSAIAKVKAKQPEFILLAEVYWGLENVLQQQGFDYTYDKHLYDRLRTMQPGTVREHLAADSGFQERLARFLENHDEPRAAAAFPPDVHQAAAVIWAFAPGLKFFHHGQEHGYRLRVPMQLCRTPYEPVDPTLEHFYCRLLEALQTSAARQESWQLLEAAPAYDGNYSRENILAFSWLGPGGQRWLAVVNYSAHQSHCRLRLPFEALRGVDLVLRDGLNGDTYFRSGNELIEQGLYVDLTPWGYHLLEIKKN